MSILQQVIDEFGITETPEALTDKTDKRASVSSVSEWSELLENKTEELSEHQVAVVVDMVAIVEMRERGIVPDHYTAKTDCSGCGTVPIFEGVPERVSGCPWCFNRLKGLPMPSPGADDGQ